MKIELVRVGDRLVGKTFSDRWNLEQLGVTSIPWTRNQNMLKKFRRFHPEFVFTAVKGYMVGITDQELGMFTRPSKVARQAA